MNSSFLLFGLLNYDFLTLGYLVVFLVYLRFLWLPLKRNYYNIYIIEINIITYKKYKSTFVLAFLHMTYLQGNKNLKGLSEIQFLVSLKCFQNKRNTYVSIGTSNTQNNHVPYLDWRRRSFTHRFARWIPFTRSFAQSFTPLASGCMPLCRIIEFPNSNRARHGGEAPTKIHLANIYSRNDGKGT